MFLPAPRGAVRNNIGKGAKSGMRQNTRDLQRKLFLKARSPLLRSSSAAEVQTQGGGSQTERSRMLPSAYGAAALPGVFPGGFSGANLPPGPRNESMKTGKAEKNGDKVKVEEIGRTMP